MEVRFYQLSKRNKSTKQPPVTGYKSVECNLKDGCTLLNPILLLQTFDATVYNYVYISKWSRYYFVANAQYIEGMYEVALTEDYLASFKTWIGSTRANILYAANSTKDLIDTRIPVLSSVTTSTPAEESLGFTLSYANMRTILGITGKGSFGCFILDDNSKLNELLDGIDDWSSFITDNWTFTKQLFFGGSASECLKSAIGIPIAFSKSDHGDLEDLNLGNYPCMDGNGNAIKGYKIYDPILDYGCNITIPWVYNDWRNTSAYTQIVLYLPLIGVITLPATEVRRELNIRIEYKINITSGDVAATVTGQTTGKKYATCSANCAMPVAFGSTGIDTNKVTQAAVTGVGTLVAMSAAAAATGGVSFATQTAIGAGMASTALQTINALGGSADGAAGLGGGAVCALDDKVRCFVTSKQLAASQSELNPIIGKPYMGVTTVNSFYGYVQTDGFQFEAAGALSSEKDAINQLLDSGIYFE